MASERPFFGRQEVTCRQCKRTYTCTPEDDYYDAETATSGICFGCLLAKDGMDPETTPVQVINLNEDGSSDPRDLALKGEEAEA